MSIGVLPTADIFAERRQRKAVERALIDAGQTGAPVDRSRAGEREPLSPRSSLLLWGLLSVLGWGVLLGPLWLILG